MQAFRNESYRARRGGIKPARPVAADTRREHLGSKQPLRVQRAIARAHPIREMPNGRAHHRRYASIRGGGGGAARHRSQKRSEREQRPVTHDVLERTRGHERAEAPDEFDEVPRAVRPVRALGVRPRRDARELAETRARHKRRGTARRERNRSARISAAAVVVVVAERRERVGGVCAEERVPVQAVRARELLRDGPHRAQARVGAPRADVRRQDGREHARLEEPSDAPPEAHVAVLEEMPDRELRIGVVRFGREEIGDPGDEGLERVVVVANA